MKRKGVIALVTAAVAAALFSVQPSDLRQPTGSDFGPVVETAATQDIEYAIAPRSRVGFGVSGDLKEEVAAARERLQKHRGDGFQIKPKDRDDWSLILALSDALERYQERLSDSKVGRVWQIKAVIDGYQEKGAKVDADLRAIVETSGNDAIDLIVGSVVVRFPEVKSMGVYVCKRSTSGSWSQHAFANAADFGGPGPWGSAQNIALLDKVNDFLVWAMYSDYLPVSQVGWRNWSGHYPGHLHVSGAPLKTGTPACA